MNILETLYNKKLIHPPTWMNNNIQYLTIMGSQAYAVSSGNSDNDYYGFVMPPKEILFPSMYGEIEGFGKPLPRFEQWSEHHIVDPSKPDISNDFSIYNIAKYFDLCMDCNPNMIDSLFTPQRCVVYMSPIANTVRTNRKLFLHKGAWHRFRGYAYSQLNKIEKQINASNPKRMESITEFGYDVKFAYHLVRLILEVEQILIEHDLDLERSKELLKSIRRGEWTKDYLVTWFSEKEKSLESVYHTSTLQAYPDEEKIKDLLMNCIEDFYGSISKSTVSEQRITSELKRKINELSLIVNRL